MDKPFNNREILTIKVPVPVPEIKRFSRWQVFLALFDPKAHFTTCTSLQSKLYVETERTARHMVDKNLSVRESWGGV